jgi:O-antigen ligase
MAGLATLATLVVLLLLYVERSILAQAVRDLLARVGLDPALFRAGIAVLAVLLVPLLAAAWRQRGMPVAGGPGRTRRLVYAGLLAAYAVTVWLPPLVGEGPDALTAYRFVLTLSVPLGIVGFSFLAPAVLRQTNLEVVVRWCLWVSVAFALVSLAWVALGEPTFFGIPLMRDPDDRGGSLAASGFFVQRNTIGSFLAVVIPAATIVAIADRRRGRTTRARVTSLGVVVLVLWLLLTFSRSSQLAVAVAAGTAVMALAWFAQPASPAAVRAQRIARRLSVAGVALLLLVAVSAAWWLPAIAPSLAAGATEALNGRLMIWQDIWQKTTDNRWIGTGLFEVQGLGPGGVRYGEVYTPHNAFLAQLAFFGIPGLVAFVLLLVAMLHEGWVRRARRLDAQDAVLLGALTGILVQNAFEHILSNPVLFSNAFSLLLFGAWRAGRWGGARDAARDEPDLAR